MRLYHSNRGLGNKPPTNPTFQAPRGDQRRLYWMCGNLPLSYSTSFSCTFHQCLSSINQAGGAAPCYKTQYKNTKHKKNNNHTTAGSALPPAETNQKPPPTPPPARRHRQPTTHAGPQAGPRNTQTKTTHQPGYSAHQRAGRQRDTAVIKPKSRESAPPTAQPSAGNPSRISL